jgi:protein-L-isoaspartate O-methyltransferase
MCTGWRIGFAGEASSCLCAPSRTGVDLPDHLTRSLDERRLALERAVDDAMFLSLWDATLKWLETESDAGTIDRLLDGNAGASYREFYAPFQRRYLALAESAVARRLSSLDEQSGSDISQVFDDQFARATYTRVAEVIDLVDFSTCHQVVNVGCGPYPAAALLIHALTSVPHVLALDNDGGAVDLAAGVIGRLGSDRITAGRADGVQFDYAAADVIYVANQVVPKKSVLRRIAATARPGTSVVVREPCGMGRLLAEEASDQGVPSGLELVRRGHADRTFHSRHVLMRAVQPS